MKTVDFLETIVACDLQVGRSRQLIVFMKYVSIQGQCHFLIVTRGHLHMKINTCFSYNMKPLAILRILYVSFLVVT